MQAKKGTVWTEANVEEMVQQDSHSMKMHGFKQVLADHSVFYKKGGDDIIYSDDISLQAVTK